MTAAARRCTLVLLATLLAAGCGPDPRTLLEPLPSMSLESFEKPVARRLSEARARIDADGQQPQLRLPLQSAVGTVGLRDCRQGL